MSAATPDDPSGRAALVAAAPGALLLFGLLVAPLALLVRVSLYAGGGTSGFGIGGGGFYEPGTWTLGAYRVLAASTYFRDVLAFTLGFGVVVALVSLVVAFPIALVVARLRGRAKLVALAAVALPKLSNVLVVIYGLELMLGAKGPVNALLIGAGLCDEPIELLHNFAGTLIGKTYLVVPYAVLVLVVALDRIDGTLVPAARGLGASPFGAFVRVTLPLALPGLGTAFFLSLVFGLGAFVSPYLMGSPDEITLAVDVQRQAFENVAWPRAAAEAVVMLLVLALVSGLWHALARIRRVR